MYIVFAYNCYYPYGGAGDIQGVFDTFSQAEVAAQLLTTESWRKDIIEIYNVSEKDVVWKNRNF